MSTISPSSITANLQQTSTINRQNNDVLSKTNKIKINENNSQIPFEIYEAAYEEEPEEDRNKLNFNNNTKNKNFIFSCTYRWYYYFAFNFSSKINYL